MTRSSAGRCPQLQPRRVIKRISRPRSPHLHSGDAAGTGHHSVYVHVLCVIRGLLRRLFLLLGVFLLLLLLLLFRRLLLLLWLGRGRLRLLEDLVCHLRQLLVLLLHVCTEKHRLLVLRERRLLRLQILQPLGDAGALLGDLAKLVRRDVAILLAWVLRRRLVVGDGARERTDPLCTELALFVTPDHGVAHLLELIQLVDVHDLRDILGVIEPVLHPREVRLEAVALSGCDEVAVLPTLSGLVAHVKDVAFEVVALLVRVEDLRHVSLNCCLLVHQLLDGGL
mmetsp:Transcript_44120/g.136340  ORF Transcript_44120/g.136340 Transcript_44120/m.136340 type:complete len:282 (-) Transcript_44120:922-1767(-)